MLLLCNVWGTLPLNELDRNCVCCKRNDHGKHTGNGKTLEQWELLAHYKNFIETQLRCYCFQDAMNTFKKIKYFKLDSMNPKDVEDYMKSFNSSFNEDQDDINLIYRTLTTVAALCEQKCRAFHGLGKSFYFQQTSCCIKLVHVVLYGILG